MVRIISISISLVYLVLFQQAWAATAAQTAPQPSSKNTTPVTSKGFAANHATPAPAPQAGTKTASSQGTASQPGGTLSTVSNGRTTSVATTSRNSTSSSARASSNSTTTSVSSNSSSIPDSSKASLRLARLTAYWPSEGDYYTRHGISATGIRLHGGHCAVDPNIIPYGSVVDIAGVGKYLAVDTGSAVISREAARGAAHNKEEARALVVDLYFDSRREGEQFAANGPKYASITWWTPSSTSQLKQAAPLFADENLTKIQSKQL